MKHRKTSGTAWQPIELRLCTTLRLHQDSMPIKSHFSRFRWITIETISFWWPVKRPSYYYNMLQSHTDSVPHLHFFALSLAEVSQVFLYIIGDLITFRRKRTLADCRQDACGQFVFVYLVFWSILSGNKWRGLTLFERGDVHAHNGWCGESARGPPQRWKGRRLRRRMNYCNVVFHAHFCTALTSDIQRKFGLWTFFLTVWIRSFSHRF